MIIMIVKSEKNSWLYFFGISLPLWCKSFLSAKNRPQCAVLCTFITLNLNGFGKYLSNMWHRSLILCWPWQIVCQWLSVLLLWYVIDLLLLGDCF